jgi:hypothetical protein
MPCNTCHGFHQWWEWQQSPGTLRRSFSHQRPADVPATAVYRVCPDCIGGVASCCDGAGASQPEPAPSGNGGQGIG